MGHGQPVSTCASNRYKAPGLEVDAAAFDAQHFSSGRTHLAVLLKPRWDWDAWNKNLETSEGIVLRKPCCWNVFGYGFMNV